MDLGLNRLQGLTCHKIQPANQPTKDSPIQSYLDNLEDFDSSSNLQVTKSLFQAFEDFPRAPTTIDITVTFIFQSFFSNLARYGSIFSVSYIFIL